MAIATSTALAIGSIAVSAGSAGMSFAQAAKQDKRAKQAQQDAQKAMDEARKKLSVNYMENLSIQKEPYELEREALLSQGAQAIQAGVESERGAAATAGRIQMSQNEAQAAQRTAMGQELSNLEKLTAQEESRIATNLGNLDLAEAQGQQQIAADAEKARAAAIQSGIESVASGIQTGISTFAPLYEKTDSAKLAGKIENQAMGSKSGQYGLNQMDMQKSIASMGSVNNVDLSGVSKLNPNEFKAFMGGLDVNTLKQIRANMPTSMSSFNPNYNPQVNPFSIF